MTKYSVFPADQWCVHLEEGVDQEVAEELRRRGHKVTWPVTGTFFLIYISLSMMAVWLTRNGKQKLVQQYQCYIQKRQTPNQVLFLICYGDLFYKKKYM